ncbi:AMP-binding protein [Hyphobacterium sp.]|uniref:AMP-binding protein n=1 Tax=Hyphobacterium sp. TaxID=2004662 RepID=UPI003BA93C6C
MTDRKHADDGSVLETEAAPETVETDADTASIRPESQSDTVEETSDLAADSPSDDDPDLTTDGDNPPAVDPSSWPHIEGEPFRLSRARKTVLQALMRAKAQAGGDQVVIIDADGRKLDYTEILRASFALGSALCRCTERGETVAVLLPTGAGSGIAYFALNTYGRIPAMLNFTAGPKAIKAACRGSKATKIVTAHKFIELGGLEELESQLKDDHEMIYLEDVREEISLTDKIRAIVGPLLPWLVAPQPKPEDTAVILFTSGTEGDPKGVALSHMNLVANVEQARSHVDILPSDIVFNSLPTFHSFGLTGGLLLPLLAGIPAVLHPSPLQGKTIMERVRKTKATVLFATDTFLNQYARVADKGDFDSLRFVVCGAERVKDETRTMVRREFDLLVLEGYGATEAAPVIAVNQPERNKPGTVGRLIPGMQARLEPVEGIEDGGRLHVKGPNVMKGYIYADNPGVINAPPDGWHDTGDIVAFDEDDCVQIKGREKRFAKIGGEMVSLAVVENIATSLWPDCLHAAVTLPDARKGEQVAIVTEYPNAERSDMVAFARSHGIAELAIPKRVIPVSEIPVLGTGKINYVAVNKLAKGED